MSREQIAAVLKRLRQSAGYTTNEVGELIGKSGKTVSAWENNRGQPDAEILIQLCDIYNVDNILNEFRDIPKIKNPPLAAEEKIIIDAYRKFNAGGKKHLLEQAVIMEKSGLYSDDVLPFATRTTNDTIELVTDINDTEVPPPDTI